MIEKVQYWVGGIIGVFLSLYKLYEWWDKKRKKKHYEDTLKKFAEDTERCERLLRELTKNDYVDRAYVFRAHDSGGKPTLGKPYYITVVDYTYADVKRDRADRYFNINVDSEYRNMITFLIDINELTLYTDNMEDCLLKRIYKSEGVVMAKIYNLAITKTDFYFMSVSWFSQPTPEQILEADLSANKIVSTYKQHHKL
jgi:hypothetical protein